MNRNITRGLGLFLFALFATGCASKSYVVLLESPDGSTGAILVETTRGVTRVDQKQHGVALDGGSARPFAVKQPRIDQDFASALAAQPALPKSYLLYFETGGAELTAQSQAAIQEVLQTLRERGPSAVSVIGHTDTMSGNAWNEQLGLLRARYIAKQLQANRLQVLKLIVTSHGERNLLIVTPDETPEPKNRRVEISIR
ncbi:OmpA family protein [Pseudomonas sp.]|uniref:OmpA family protein n=1 Tax=Pseudomonas sp. TaxID=306 RepID=UPI00299F24FE|nr:OmpA family protein [Pseudomonas sp.]MDX1369885.1 OmpA family protein [Pseudomonas sp.]